MDQHSELSQQQPFHSEASRYTLEDNLQIEKFLGQEYPSFSLPRGPRDGLFKVEIPNFPDADKMKTDILATIPEELQSCHPLLRRRDITVRFVSALKENGTGESVTDGDILELTNKNSEVSYLIRLVIDQSDKESTCAQIVAGIVHEIAETDYYLKSPKGTEDSTQLLGTPEYSLTEDEEVANRWAIRAIRRIYPDAHFEDLEYAQDK
jgi:hypothetical protein